MAISERTHNMRDGLTDRELEVLAAMADGMSNEEIGAILFLSPTTVKTHAKRIAVKLEVNGRASSRAAAVAKALRMGYIA